MTEIICKVTKCVKNSDGKCTRDEITISMGGAYNNCPSCNNILGKNTRGSCVPHKEWAEYLAGEL